MFTLNDKHNVYSIISEKHTTLPEILAQSVPHWRRREVKPYIKHDLVSVTKDSPVCVLTPDDQNVHEITAPDGAAAFQDILSPPYGEERVCGYFDLLEQEGALKQVQGKDGQNILIQYIKKGRQPPDFFCEPFDLLDPVLLDPEEDTDDKQQAKNFQSTNEPE